MPTYEYRCGNCGHKFSRFQRIVDEPVRDCPKCNKRNSVSRLISGGAGLIFKGSGFYITDYKRKATETGEKKSPATPDKKETKETETKKK
ncbi:MAG: FmdB family zinc ribbon protein [candidate division WOR-3 bacterium]